MYIPEYSITPKTLSNIANIEYAKALIDTSTLLPTWEKQLQKEAMVTTISHLLELENIERSQEHIKIHIENYDKENPDLLVITIHNLLQHSKDEQPTTLDEGELKDRFFEHTQIQAYRRMQIEGKSAPQEILADMVELFDWINSIDAKQTHPAIVIAIIINRLEDILPFESLNSWFSSFVALNYLRAFNYTFNNYLPLGYFHINSQVQSIIDNQEKDITEWIEYVTKELAIKVEGLVNQSKSFATETKLSTVSDRGKLTGREQKIVLYLQDFGNLTNKDYPKLFPNISEDTVLRTLKKLIEKGIVVKKGSTKNSRYELS